MYHNDLIFWEVVVAMDEEAELEAEEVAADAIGDEFTWDKLVLLDEE